MNDAVKYPDHTVTITGIPVGTRYTIEEETPLDGSRLQSVTVPKDCDSADVIDNTMVEGVIKEANTSPITAIFTNTKRRSEEHTSELQSLKRTRMPSSA